MSNPADKINITQTLYDASNMLGNQGVYFVDLLDERGLRKERDMPIKNKVDPVKDGLIIAQPLNDADSSILNVDIETMTKELVALLVKKRCHEASKESNTIVEKKSIFIGYAVDQRPNERPYHFVAGGVDSDIDPVAVQV